MAPKSVVNLLMTLMVFSGGVCTANGLLAVVPAAGEDNATRRHGTQVRACVSPAGTLLAFVEHWHGSMVGFPGGQAPGTMTLVDDATGIQDTRPPDLMVPSTTIAGLDSYCMHDVFTTLISDCPAQHGDEDWVVYNFTLAGCDESANYTFISGNTQVLMEAAACPWLYPATVSGSIACPPTPAPTQQCENNCCTGRVLRHSAGSATPTAPTPFPTVGSPSGDADWECCYAWGQGLVSTAETCEAYTTDAPEGCVWICPTPAPTPVPTPVQCSGSCCTPVVAGDPAQCCDNFQAGILTDPASCEAFHGGTHCLWTCPTPSPTPMPTPAPSKSDCLGTCCEDGPSPPPFPGACCAIYLSGAGNTPATCQAYGGDNPYGCVWTCPPTHSPTPHPTATAPFDTPSPTLGLAPTPKFPFTPVATPSPTIGLAPTPKIRKRAKVEGSFQVRVSSAEADDFVSDPSVKAAFKRSIAARASVGEADVTVTLSVVTGGGSAGRHAWVGGQKRSPAQVGLDSAGQAEIQVGYEIAVEEEVEASTVQGALTTVSAEEFTSSFSAQLDGSSLHAGTAVEAVAASAAAPTVNVDASAVGDPHLVNIHGQRFDLMQPGNHTMIWIPRGAPPSRALLGVMARAERIGNSCSDMYIQDLAITGEWVAGVHGARRLNTNWGVQYSAQKPPRRGSGSAGWNTYGNIRMKVTWGHTAEGVKYINLLVHNLIHAGYTVGGLLGEDDHTTASTPTRDCQRFYYF